MRVRLAPIRNRRTARSQPQQPTPPAAHAGHHSAMATAKRPGLAAILAKPAYRRLFAAQTISRWGDTFNTVALVVLVFRLTGSGPGRHRRRHRRDRPGAARPNRRRGHRPAAAGAGAGRRRPVAHGPGWRRPPGRPAPGSRLCGGVPAGGRRGVLQPGRELGAAQPRGRGRAGGGQLRAVVGHGHLPDRAGTIGWRPGRHCRSRARVPGQRGQLRWLRAAAGRAAPARPADGDRGRLLAGPDWRGDADAGLGSAVAAAGAGATAGRPVGRGDQRPAGGAGRPPAPRRSRRVRVAAGRHWGRRRVRSAASPAGQQSPPAGAGVRAAAAAWPGRPGLGQQPLPRTSNLELSGRELDRPARQPGQRRGGRRASVAAWCARRRCSSRSTGARTAS